MITYEGIYKAYRNGILSYGEIMRYAKADESFRRFFIFKMTAE